MPDTRVRGRLEVRADADGLALPGVARLAGTMAGAIGVIVLVGWLFEVESLKRVAPGLVTMKSNTAICIVALGAVLVEGGRGWFRRLMLGAVVALVVATLAEYALGVSFGIDELLFTDVAPGASYPGRMAVSTAVCFIVLAAVLAQTSTRYGRWRQGLTVTIFAVAWVGLLGYVFGATHLYSIGLFSTMAVHTAVAVLLLAVGVQATIPGSLLVWAVRSRDAGGFALRQFLPVAALVLPGIAYARLAGEQLGWYDTEFGLALMVTASSIVVCFVAARASGRLTRLDAERARALAELEALNVDLENRVDERTNDLAASEAWARSLAASAPIGIFHTDIAGACTYTNDRWQEICGVRAVDALGAGWKAGIHPNDRPQARAAWDTAAATATVFDAQYRVRRPTGDVRWVRARATGVVDLAGDVTGFVGTLEDTTERRVAEEQFRTAFESAPIGMALIDRNGAFLRTNAALSDMVGYDSNELQSMQASSLVHPDDLRVIEGRQAGPLGGTNNDRRLVRADGTEMWASVRLAPIIGQAGEAGFTLAQILDITEKRRSEAELFHLANHDPLTGLLNRRSFEAALEAHVARVRRHGSDGALLFVDIDHFKSVNDAHGHHLGDEVIVAVSNAMRARLRSTDIIARVGGDEFAVLLPTGGADVTHHVADMLVNILRDDIANVAGKELGLTASIGLALFDAAGLSADEMLIRADLAMYDAKARGRDQWAETPPQDRPVNSRHPPQRLRLG